MSADVSADMTENTVKMVSKCLCSKHPVYYYNRDIKALVPTIHDHQVYYFHVDPAALDACVSHDVRLANQWYHENGMLVNESKHHGLVLGDTDYSFSFPVKDTLEILGMEIDNKLNFSSHISNVLSKGSIINLMLCSAFENLYPGTPYLSFTKRTFHHNLTICSSVWHFCGVQHG